MHIEGVWYAVCVLVSLWLWVQTGLPVSGAGTHEASFPSGFFPTGSPSPLLWSKSFFSSQVGWFINGDSVGDMSSLLVSSGKASSYSSPFLIPSFLLSFPLLLLVHISPHPPSGRQLIWAQPLLTWPFGPISCLLMSDCLLGPPPTPIGREGSISCSHTHTHTHTHTSPCPCVHICASHIHS